MLSRAASWVRSRRVRKTPIFNWPSSLLRLRIYTFWSAHPGGSIRTQLPKLQNRSNFTLITPPAVRPTPNQPSQSTATLPHYLTPNKLKNTYQPSQSTAKLSHYFNVRQTHKSLILINNCFGNVIQPAFVTVHGCPMITTACYRVAQWSLHHDTWLLNYHYCMLYGCPITSASCYRVDQWSLILQSGPVNTIIMDMVIEWSLHHDTG